MQDTKATKDTRLSIKKISKFDPKTIVLRNKPRLFRNNNFIQKSHNIGVEVEKGDVRTPGFRSLQPRFSFGLRGFESGEWSIHLSFGPTRDSVRGTKEYEALKKELKVMKELQKTLEKKVSDDMEGKRFLFLRESEDDEFGKEYSSYVKVLPDQTVIKIGDKTYKSEEDFRKIEGRMIDVMAVAFEVDKISVCPKVVSVKPKLVCLLGEFRHHDTLLDWGDVIFSEEEED